MIPQSSDPGGSWKQEVDIAWEWGTFYIRATIYKPGFLSRMQPGKGRCHTDRRLFC